MKARKILFSTLALILILSFILSLASCKKDKGGEDDTGGSTEPLVVFDGSDADYKIIYSTDVTNTLRASILNLKAELENITGKTVAVSSDTSKNNKETAREIVIGRTTRAQSATAFERLSGVGYRYDRIDDKLTIVGTNDYLTAKGVEEFISALTVEGNRITAEGNMEKFTDCSSEMISLIDENGAFAYEIIVAKESELFNISNSFKNKVEDLLNKDGKHTVKIKVKYDAAVPVEAGAKEILVGKTNRAQSKALYADIGYFAYRMFNEGDSILVGAYKETVAMTAMNKLFEYIKEAYDSSADGNCWIPKGFDVKDETYGWTNQLPNLKEATFNGIYDAGDGTYLLRYTDAADGIYTGYVNKLKNDGFTLARSYNMGQNKYSLLYGEEMNAYVSYIKSSGEIRVFLEQSGTQYPTDSQIKPAGSYTPTLYQLRVDNYGSRENGGMSYIIQMSNGNFIIVDGGYNTEEEADHIYKFLKSKLPAGQKPVIEAWFITHLHGDHYGAFLAFSSKYTAAHAEVRGVYWNFPEINTNIATSAISGIEASAKKWGATVYGKLHTGMSIDFTGVKVNVMCTHEDLYPANPIDGNDTTTVLRFDVAGQRVMFLGDCRDNECAKMLQSFGDSTELKADIVQWSHHGYEGATKAIYEKIGAHTVLFPMNVVGWQISGHGEDTDPNTYSIVSSWIKNYNLPCGNYLASNTTVKNILIAGLADNILCTSCAGVNAGGHCGAYHALPLPYTADSGKRGETLVNWCVSQADSYYNAHKNDRAKRAIVS